MKTITSSLGTEVFVLNVVCAAITSITLGLRIWTRAFIVRAMWVDDWLMVITQFLFLGQTAMMAATGLLGMGEHISDLEIDQRVQVIYVNTIAWWIYVICGTTLRLSVAFLYLRITILPWQRTVLWALMFIYTSYSLVYFIFLINRCSPVAYAWTLYYQDGRSGFCVRNTVRTSLGYARNALSIANDWILALLPIPLVMKTQMNLSSKIMTTFLLGLGAFASIASIIRLTKLHSSYISKDYTWTIPQVMLWSTIESAAGIIAANGATLRPFLRRFFKISDPLLSSRREGATGDEGSTEPKSTSGRIPMRSRERSHRVQQVDPLDTVSDLFEREEATIEEGREEDEQRSFTTDKRPEVSASTSNTEHSVAVRNSLAADSEENLVLPTTSKQD